MKRLFIIYNPRSSRFCDVEQEVLQKVSNLKGYLIAKYEIMPTDVDQNAITLSKLLKDGDLIISAGGDATACVAANACLLSGKDATLAVLPYGNFNDLARTLKIQKFEQIFYSDTKTVDFYPLEIIIDNKFFRYATCYVTIGMTAESVELFDSPHIRKKLQKGHKSSWRSYLYLADWYFKNRHQRVFLPEFKLNGRFKPHDTSDYAAVNGSSMCRVMKGREDYLSCQYFHSTTGRLTNLLRLSSLMAKSVCLKVPGTTTSKDIIEFTQPATVELQAEGEYRIFKDINQIEIRKAAKCLKVKTIS